MSKPVKGGYLLRHKKRVFGKDWREEWVVLYEDSTIAWYKEKGRREPEGSVVVKGAPEMFAVSQWTLRIPGRPDLPAGCEVVQLMAFGTKGGEKVHWLLAQSEEEVNDWLTAISNTIPPPPQPPDECVNHKHVDCNDSRIPPTPVLPSDSYHPVYTTHLLTADSNQLYHARYNDQTLPLSPESPETTRLLVQNNTELSTGLIIAPAAVDLGQGVGWVGYNSNAPYQRTLVHDFDRNVTVDISSHVSTAFISNSYICDSYFPDTYHGCDDADFGMDCGGDFGF